MNNFLKYFTSSFGCISGLLLGFYILGELDDYYENKKRNRG